MITGGRSPGWAAGSSLGVSASRAKTDTLGFSLGGAGTTCCVPQSGHAIVWPTCFSAAYISVAQLRHVTAMYFGWCGDQLAGQRLLVGVPQLVLLAFERGRHVLRLRRGRRRHDRARAAIGAFDFFADLVEPAVHPRPANAAFDADVLGFRLGVRFALRLWRRFGRDRLVGRCGDDKRRCRIAAQLRPAARRRWRGNVAHRSPGRTRTGHLGRWMAWATSVVIAVRDAAAQRFLVYTFAGHGRRTGAVVID